MALDDQDDIRISVIVYILKRKWNKTTNQITIQRRWKDAETQEEKNHAQHSEYCAFCSFICAAFRRFFYRSSIIMCLGCPVIMIGVSSAWIKGSI